MDTPRSHTLTILAVMAALRARRPDRPTVKRGIRRVKQGWDHHASAAEDRPAEGQRAGEGWHDGAAEVVRRCQTGSSLLRVFCGCSVLFSKGFGARRKARSLDSTDRYRCVPASAGLRARTMSAAVVCSRDGGGRGEQRCSCVIGRTRQGADFPPVFVSDPTWHSRKHLARKPNADDHPASGARKIIGTLSYVGLRAHCCRSGGRQSLVA